MGFLVRLFWKIEHNLLTEFLKQNGIKHIHSAPYHPATNEEAERFIQTIKNSMKTAKYDWDKVS